MSHVRPMSRAERAALADAIQHMRNAGIRPRDIIVSGAPQRSVSAVQPKRRIRLPAKREML